MGKYNESVNTYQLQSYYVKSLSSTVITEKGVHPWSSLLNLIILFNVHIHCELLYYTPVLGAQVRDRGWREWGEFLVLSVVECPLKVLWVVGSIRHGGPIELFLIPTSAP